MTTIGGRNQPFRASCSAYDICRPPNNYRAGQKYLIYHNTDLGVITQPTPCGCPPATPNTPIASTNPFTPTANYKDFGLCNKVGWKQVAAVRQWHGTFGFQSHDPNGFADSECDNSGTPLFYERYQPNADQTKYTHIEFSGTQTHTASLPEPPPNNFSESISGYLEVDPNSGTLTSTVSHSVGFYLGNLLSTGGNMFTASFVCGTQIYHPSHYTMDEMIGILRGIASSYGGPTISPRTSVSSYDTGALIWTYNDGVFFYTFTTRLSFTLTNTVFQFDFTYHLDTYRLDDPTITALNEVATHVTVTLSNPNTATNVTDDLATLLGYWPLNDDTLYPWRTDKYQGCVPFLYRNEVQADTSPWVNQFSGWTDPNIAALTTGTLHPGDIIGAPIDISVGGYAPDDYWFSGYKGFVWDECPPGSGNRKFFGQFNGQWRSLADGQIPPRCTQWTDRLQGSFLTIGESLMYPVTTGNGNVLKSIWATKWAETAVRLPSYDYSTPSGMDKFLLDETACYCYSGGVLTTLNGAAHPVISDTSGYWGGQSAGGFYPITSYDHTTGVITLGSKAFNVPSGWQSKGVSSTLDDTGTVFGRLRFTDGSNNPPSLKGRASCAYSGTTCTFSTAQPAFGRAVAGTEQIDVWDANMTSLASNITATRISDTTFTTPSGYPTSKWITIHGAPAWYWADNTGKGNFALLQFGTDLRTGGEATRLQTVSNCVGTGVIIIGGQATLHDDTGNYVPFFTGGQLYNAAGTTSPNYGWSTSTFLDDCKSWSQCTPYRIVLSPCDVDDPVAAGGQGEIYDLTNRFIDQRYGSQQWLIASQAMVDPAWQIPHQPCGLATGVWRMDDNTCQIDSGINYYYRFNPLVESRIQPPIGGSTVTPPDNGAGASQNEAPTLALYPANPPIYAMFEPDLYPPGTPGLVTPPPNYAFYSSPGIWPEQTQPVHTYLPDGIWNPCP